MQEFEIFYNITKKNFENEKKNYAKWKIRSKAYFCYILLNIRIDLQLSKLMPNIIVKPILVIFAPFKFEKGLIFGFQILNL